MKLTKKQLNKMILKEMAMPQSSNNDSLNKELAIALLENVINDLQNVPEQNLKRYIAHLIDYQIPNIIRTLKE